MYVGNQIGTFLDYLERGFRQWILAQLLKNLGFYTTTKNTPSPLYHRVVYDIDGDCNQGK